MRRLLRWLAPLRHDPEWYAIPLQTKKNFVRSALVCMMIGITLGFAAGVFVGAVLML